MASIPFAASLTENPSSSKLARKNRRIWTSSSTTSTLGMASIMARPILANSPAGILQQRRKKRRPHGGKKSPAGAGQEGKTSGAAGAVPDGMLDRSARALALDRDARTFDDVGILRLGQEERADDEGNRRHTDRIPQTGVDIAGGRDDGGGEQRQHAAEPAVADVIGQRHRGVADLGREQLH